MTALASPSLSNTGRGDAPASDRTAPTCGGEARRVVGRTGCRFAVGPSPPCIALVRHTYDFPGHHISWATRTSTRAAPGVPGWSVAGVVPGTADADAHVEGNVERVGATHLATDEGLQRLTLTLGDLEHELVVDLQQQP